MDDKVKITGYLKEVRLIDIKGISLGEAPHYSLQIVSPIQNEIYISDSNSNLEKDILDMLFRIKYIKNISDYEVITEDNFVNIALKENIYA